MMLFSILMLFGCNKNKAKTEAGNEIENFPSIGGVFVSKQITEQNKMPLFIYREKREGPQDSGWRIFSGFESDEYINNPENIAIYDVSSILKIDTSLKDLLLTGIGSVFERKNANSEWYEVTDFKLDDDYLVTYSLTDNWYLTINNLFERINEESGNILYTTGDKSLRIAVWNDPEKSKEQILQEHIAQIQNRIQNKTELFDFSDNFVKRIGYKTIEHDGDKKYQVIYAFSIIDNQILQLAFYYDNYKDESWAIETWKNILVK